MKGTKHTNQLVYLGEANLFTSPLGKIVKIKIWWAPGPFGACPKPLGSLKPLNQNHMDGTPPLRGEPYPVFKCGQNVKVNIKVNTAEDFDFDFDFNILTA